MATALEESVSLSLNIKDGVKPNILKSTKWTKILDVNERILNFKQLIPEPAKEYQFELDTFQKQAILCLEQHENVLVAAHTSAGKTVVAEYAIAMSIKRNSTRVVYTAPIKALSNQKFRDFRQVFGSKEIGLITGDVQINTDAPCLIMTTEILLHMLYNGAPLIQDLEWVIFDEVHYVNDSERGHVWEEVFIMLPENIRLVLLSATVPNVVEFGDWLGATRKKVTSVIYTNKRPIPLQHYLYTGNNKQTIDNRFMFLGEAEKYLREGYAQALDSIKARKQTRTPMEKQERGTYAALIKHLEKQDKLPVIIFTLSRKRCDFNARILSESLDLIIDKRKKGKIHKFIQKCLRNLKNVDKKLPQIEALKEILKTGFGVHHSGILPILKEITEILFQEGLVKVLFATETFAMGVNMPARTVVFDSILKHDGTIQRNLLPSEYIQMAGRAGRRGKDPIGFVYIMCKNDVPEEGELRQMSMGKGVKLESKFRLTYNLILSTLRTRERMKIESVLEKSFLEHDGQKKLPDLIAQQNVLKNRIKEFKTDDCVECEKDLNQFCYDYLDYKNYIKELMPKVLTQIINSKKKNTVLQNGRLMLILSDLKPFLFGILLRLRVTPSAKESELTVLAFDLFSLIEHRANLDKVKPKIVTIKSDSIQCIYKKCFKNVNPSGICSSGDEAKHAIETCLDNVLEYIKELEHSLPISSISSLFFLPFYDTYHDFGINDIDFVENYNKLLQKRNTFLSYECLLCPNFEIHYKGMMEKIELEIKLKQITYQISPESLKFLPDYHSRLQVLKYMNYINDDELLELKGRIACLISEHELVLTELITENIFLNLDPAEIAGLLSCFVFPQDSDDQPKLTQNLESVSKLVVIVIDLSNH